MNARPFAAVLALGLGAAGCGGGSHAVPPHAAAAPAAKQRVAFTMRWPSRAATAARRPSFVSPSAASVIVEVNPDAAPAGAVTFANAPAGGGTSTIAIDAPPGNDVFLISVYDQPQTTGETAATGNELGRVRVAQTVLANTTNTLSATVVGTVAAVRIGPLPNQSAVVPIPASSPAGYELVGRAPAVFTVAPLDVDGNVIVQPDAPPAISLAPNVRATGVFTVTPVTGTTDQFTVQAVAPNTTQYPTSLVATATDANGNLATSSTVVDVTSAVYVAYANGGAPSVARFDPHGTPLPLPAGAFAGLGDPQALAYDPADRAIFVADAAHNTVLAFDESGAPLAGYAAPAVAGANGVTYDPHNGNVYASGSAGVTVFAPNGGPPLGGVPPSFAAANARGIAFMGPSPNGSLNALAVGDTGTPQLAFFRESGSPAGTSALSAAPIAVAFGAPVPITQTPQTLAQLYVTTASGIVAFDAYGGPLTTAADAGAPFGIAIDPNVNEPRVADRGANALTTYLDDLSAVDAARTFTTAAALGLTQPQGVCHVF